MSTKSEVKVPGWCPPTHPCRWSKKQLEYYDRKMDQVPMEEWRAIDDAIMSRECDNPHCEMGSSGFVPSAEEAPTTTEYEAQEQNQRRSVDTLVAEATEAVQTKKYDFEKLLPDGYPGDWTAAEWHHVDELLNKLPADVSSDLEDTLWERQLDEQLAVLEGRDAEEEVDIFAMSAAEYEEYVKKQMAEALAEAPAELPASTGSKAPPPGAPCKVGCDGPGSKLNRFKDHVPSCPQHPDYTEAKWLDPSKPGAFGTSWHTCKHDRQEFQLENGLSIYASAYRDVKFKTDEKVQVGVYMYDSWGYGCFVTPGLNVPWKSDPKFTYQALLDWPDFGVPDLEEVPLVDIVTWMLEQIAAGVSMETGCMGGHGRTGTMLACLLVAQGVTPGQALQRVRKEHCEKAVENEKQGHFVAEFYKLFHGNEEWRKSKTERKLFDKQVKLGHKQKGGSTGFKGATAGPAPVFDKELNTWTSHGYRTGFSWDKELKLYVNPNYTPEGGDKK